MDPRTLHPILYALVFLGLTAVLVVTLHGHAVRHGGSLTEDLGARGGLVALEVWFAAGLFSEVIMAVLYTPYNIPADWTRVLIEAPIFGTLGVGLLFLAWREVAQSIPPSRAPFAQKS